MMEILQNALCSPPTALCVDCVHGREIRSNDSVCCFHNSLEQFPLCLVSVSVGAGEDIFHKSSVGHIEGLRTESGLLQHPNEIQTLLGSFHCSNSVFRPVQIVRHMTAEELEAVFLLHLYSLDGEGLQSPLLKWCCPH